MQYQILTGALPVFYAPQSNGSAFSKSDTAYALANKPITALHYHDAMELGVCVSGSGQAYIGDRIYAFGAGDIQVVPPHKPHFSRANEGEASEWVFITIEPKSCLRQGGFLSPADSVDLTDSGNYICGIFAADEYPELTAAVTDIVDVDATNDEYTSLAVALAVARFLIVSARLSRVIGGGKSQRSSGVIAPALEFIGNNLDDSEGLSEQRLAKLCHVSVATLRRLFIKHTGLAPKAFIVRSRMAYAEYLLRKSTLSVLEIAAYVGYSEVSGFNRTFKAVFGVSPLNYRKN